MAGISMIPMFFLLVLSMTCCSYAQNQTCSNYAFSGNRVFSSCADLPVLNSFLHYNYDSSSGNLQIAYRHTGVSSKQWVAWAVNPISTGMVGSQALIAFQQTDGTMRVYKTPIASYGTQLQEGNLSFPVSDLSATYAKNEMIIFATLGGFNNANSTNLNHVWQDGPLSGNTPLMHSTSGPNVLSMGTLNIVSGQTRLNPGGGKNSRMKKVHGIVNVVSWGILMPLGATIARYLKVFKSANPAWFYLHVSCQLSAYIIGVAGWGTGLKLGAESPGIQHSSHRNIGVTLFSLATLQVFALFFRPKPDHKLRVYWNIYHQVVGYSVIVLSVINIFKGFDILQPEEKWKNAYIGFIAALAFVALLLEAFTWIVVLKRKRSEATRESQAQQGVNGSTAEHV